MFNLDKYEALKIIMEKGKKVISDIGGVYHIEKGNLILEKNNYTSYFDYKDFLSNINSNKYKEYNEPRKYEFETYLGENFGVMPFGKCPMEVALKHQCSGLNDDYNNLKSMYKKVSKVKVTLEFIE